MFIRVQIHQQQPKYAKNKGATLHCTSSVSTPLPPYHQHHHHHHRGNASDICTESNVLPLFLPPHDAASVIKLSGVSSISAAAWLSALVAFINFLFTFVGVSLVEKAGRRKLTLTSLFGWTFFVFFILMVLFPFFFCKCLMTASRNSSYCLFMFNS